MMSQTKKLSIAFYWHMHQPVYQLSPTGDYLMPWVRLHAIKDYLDMVMFVEKFPSLKLNFNIVPVLLDALIDYGENGLHDIHSRLTVTDTKDLSDDDKFFILNNFFDSNYHSMILPNEEYNRLYQKYQTTEDISSFSEQEYSDLMALFNLVWFDPSHKDKYPELKKLLKKKKNYTLEDRIKIIDIQRDIINKIIPCLKKHIKDGKIEVTTSPYYHPILPILLDINSIKKTTKSEDLPQNLKMILDAKVQTNKALDRIEELLGIRPKGIWPSEQCIDTNVMELIKQTGAEWTIADEGILSDSINFEFSRDFRGYMEDPYHLLKTYDYKGTKIIFRDSFIPNLIGFEYPNHDPEGAANDLYDRFKIIQSKLLSSPDDNHLLTIAMDGENCWENYKEDGIKFLSTIYSLIEKDPSIETVLLSDYIENDNQSKSLNKIASGSWVNRNFKLWIDEPLKNLAWNYLKQVRDDLSKMVRENPLNPNIEAAIRELFICEGSDWFWWYGEPNDSGRDNIFDYIFREHLKNIYKYMGHPMPEYLDIPLLSAISKPSRYPKGEFTPIIDGKDKDDDSWLNAGCIKIPDGPVLKENKFYDKICFGYDKDYFYLRFYINEYLQQEKLVSKQVNQMYVYMRNKEKRQPISPVRIIQKTENILPISKEKFHNELQISIYNGEINLVRLVRALPNNLWTITSSKRIKAVYEKYVDVSIPFDNIDIEKGDTLEFMFVNARFGIKEYEVPNEMLLTIKRI